MSHVSTVEVQVKDLEALKMAAKELGGVFVEGQTTYKAHAMQGKCDHAIRVHGVDYEVGVLRQPDGTYTLALDTWGYDGRSGDGLVKAFGKNCENLVQAYAVRALRNAFEPHGYVFQEEQSKDGVRQFQMVRGW